MPELRIVFIGTSEYGIPSLKLLAEHPDYRPVLVISQPDRPFGRKLQLKASPLAELAESLGLEIRKPERVSDPAFVQELASFEPDLIITASYGEIIGKTARNMPRLGAINLHPSLLPLYRGASPIQSALQDGCTQTGISIFRLGPKMDAGPLHLQVSHEILPEDNFTSLHARLAEATARLLPDYLLALQEGRIIEAEQDEAHASYCHKIEKQQQLLDWNNPAPVLHNHIRSISYSPGAFQYFRGSALKILGSRVLDADSTGAPGTIAQILKNQGFTVNTGDKQLLITELQASGKKQMSSWAFCLGSRLEVGDKLFIARENGKLEV